VAPDLCRCSDLTVMLFGPSRSGKSSFVNTAMNSNKAAVGAATGYSTTTNAANYIMTVKNSTTINVLDTPGLYDNRLQLSNREVKKKVEIILLEHSKNDYLDAILVFETVADDKVELPRTLSNLEDILGSNYKSSVIVVLTKKTWWGI